MRLTSLVLAAVLACVGCTMPEPFCVMSFNIRYGTAEDGDNHWQIRHDLVLQTILANEPDVIGLQEVLDFQAHELRAALEDYEFVGVGRDDGLAKGEFAPIMFRRKLFQLVDCGFLWLCENVDQPGKCGWDAACPRMLTWVRLGFKRSPFNSVYVINTHFDHVGARARLESARIIRRTTDALGGSPIIVMGDFNCGPGSPPYQELTADRGNLAELRDSHTLLGHDETLAGTFNGFRGDRSGPRIDMIFVNRRFEVLQTAIDRRSFAALGADIDGHRYPSDHFPVTAVVRLLPASDIPGM